MTRWGSQVRALYRPLDVKPFRTRSNAYLPEPGGADERPEFLGMIPRNPIRSPLMARPKSDRPSYCLHKQSGRARVTIDGKQKLLPGVYGSPESRGEYDRLVGMWLANGRTLPAAPDAPTGPTVSV